MGPRYRGIALAAIFLGIGILVACFLPSTALVVIISIAIVAVGFFCLRC